MTQAIPPQQRILIIDDDQDIWKAYRLILSPADHAPESATAKINEILSNGQAVDSGLGFELSFASQGQTGYQMVAEARESQNPFALAFIDIRMPPGWDGMETAVKIRQLDPDIELVIVTAYSDRSMDEIVRAVGSPDKLLFLRKPFDPDELKQMARSLTSKWRLARMEEQERLARQRVEEQLQQAQKMESIGTLAGGIAHDFNNILSAVMGYTDLALLRAKDRDPELESDLAQIRKAADRAADLVRQILTFSRRQTREKMPMHVVSVVKEALKLLRASIPATIDIRHDIQSEATVMADPTQIHQLIMNLCTNGYQAMSDTGGVLTVSLRDNTIGDNEVFADHRPLPAGPYVVLTVADTGSGMAPETISKIFEPYFTTKEKGKGTGLGLAVVKGILDTHLGAITITSEPGRGSLFTAYLPASTEKGSRVDIQNAPEIPVAANHERVMVVDDESTLRDLAQQFLTAAGYQVDLYTNGLEAYQALALSPHAWHLLVTDQTMPGMTGEQLAAKALAIRPDLPIILCSGHGYGGASDQGNKLGLAGYLQKPIDRDTLLVAVTKSLHGNQTKTASPP